MKLSPVKQNRLHNARLLQATLKGNKQDEMCRVLNKPQSQVSAFMGANPSKGIGDKIAAQIEQAFDKPSGWLDTWHDPKEFPGIIDVFTLTPIRIEQEVREPSNLTYAPTQAEPRKMPVISWVQAGHWSEAIDLYQTGDAESWEPTSVSVGNHAFWLKVVGDSMTAPTGLSIPEGYLILVDPDAHADNGSLVVAKLTDSDEVTFKKLVIDAGQHYLKPLNPSYNTIHVNGNCEIVGVVKEVKLKI